MGGGFSSSAKALLPCDHGGFVMTVRRAAIEPLSRYGRPMSESPTAIDVLRKLLSDPAVQQKIKDIAAEAEATGLIDSNEAARMRSRIEAVERERPEATTPTDPRVFAVEMAVHGGVTYLVPLKRAVDEWIDGHDGDAALLPAVYLENGQPREALRLRLAWIGIDAQNAWEAMTRTAGILREGCPALVDETVELAVTAEVHDPRIEYRRPHGA